MRSLPPKGWLASGWRVASLPAEFWYSTMSIVTLGFKRKLVPTTGDMLTAQRLLLERLVPALKSSELTGAGRFVPFPCQ